MVAQTRLACRAASRSHRCLLLLQQLQVRLGEILQHRAHPVNRPRTLAVVALDLPLEQLVHLAQLLDRILLQPAHLASHLHDARDGAELRGDRFAQLFAKIVQESPHGRCAVVVDVDDQPEVMRGRRRAAQEVKVAGYVRAGGEGAEAARLGGERVRAVFDGDLELVEEAADGLALLREQLDFGFDASHRGVGYFAGLWRRRGWSRGGR